MLGAAPFSHVLGQSTGLVATLATGGAVAVVPRFEPGETLALMAATGTTVLLGVPTMCVALCEAAASAGELPPLRLAHVGGAAVPVEVAREFEGTFGADVYEGYGLTEISGIATTYRRASRGSRARSGDRSATRSCAIVSTAARRPAARSARSGSAARASSPATGAARSATGAGLGGRLARDRRPRLRRRRTATCSSSTG